MFSRAVILLIPEVHLVSAISSVSPGSHQCCCEDEIIIYMLASLTPLIEHKCEFDDKCCYDGTSPACEGESGFPRQACQSFSSQKRLSEAVLDLNK